MTTISVRSVGLCAHFSPVGDRALRYALSLAMSRNLQLNVFSFLQDPYVPHGEPPAEDHAAHQKRRIRTEFELRSYYEDRLKDYLQVGFKVCEGDEEVELRRCLKGGEYQVLVVPYLERGGFFAGRAIEEFASHFLSPVVLVGRWRKVRYYLNAQATLMADKLHLFEGTWRSLPERDAACRAC